MAKFTLPREIYCGRAAYSVITNYPSSNDYLPPEDITTARPSHAVTIPNSEIAFTGMDAMAHAIEAYVSTMRCDYTDPLALYAIKMISTYLIASHDGNLKARERMQNAQYMARIIFSNALLGIVHSLAHCTGAIFSGRPIPHGCANAMYLPKVIRFNAAVPEIAERYARIAKFIGLPGTDTNTLVDALIAHILTMNNALNIPACIREYEDGKIAEVEFFQKLPLIAKKAVGDACTGSNPRSISIEEMRQLLTCCYYDTQVNF